MYSVSHRDQEQREEAEKALWGGSRKGYLPYLEKKMSQAEL